MIEELRDEAVRRLRARGYTDVADRLEQARIIISEATSIDGVTEYGTVYISKGEIHLTTAVVKCTRATVLAALVHEATHLTESQLESTSVGGIHHRTQEELDTIGRTAIAQWIAYDRRADDVALNVLESWLEEEREGGNSTVVQEIEQAKATLEAHLRGLDGRSFNAKFSIRREAAGVMQNAIQELMAVFPNDSNELRTLRRAAATLDELRGSGKAETLLVLPLPTSW